MKRLIILFIPMLVCACGSGFLTQMRKLASDPTTETPRVTSFIDELTCQVEWTEDLAADTVILERANDSASPAYDAVYTGTGTSYTDTSVADQGRYLYRLRKVKGDVTFDPSPVALGIGNATCRDALEPNDSEAGATVLEYERSGNMYFYRSYAGDVVQDVDWFQVSVPPMRTAHIIITQAGLGAGAAATKMYFYRQGTPRVAVINNQDNPIVNSSVMTQTFLFSVYPNPDEFISNPTLAGGTVIEYTITLDSITQ